MCSSSLYNFWNMAVFSYNSKNHALVLLYIDHLIRWLSIDLHGQIIVSVILQIGITTCVDLRTSFRQVIHDGASRGRYYLVAVLYRQIEHPAKIVIGVITY